MTFVNGEIIRIKNEEKKPKKNICSICGGKRKDRRMIPENPDTLFAGDLCPSKFHGKLAGYNCY